MKSSQSPRSRPSRRQRPSWRPGRPWCPSLRPCASPASFFAPWSAFASFFASPAPFFASPAPFFASPAPFFAPSLGRRALPRPCRPSRPRPSSCCRRASLPLLALQRLAAFSARFRQHARRRVPVERAAYVLNAQPAPHRRCRGSARRRPRGRSPRARVLRRELVEQPVQLADRGDIGLQAGRSGRGAGAQGARKRPARTCPPSRSPAARAGASRAARLRAGQLSGRATRTPAPPRRSRACAL